MEEPPAGADMQWRQNLKSVYGAVIFLQVIVLMGIKNLESGEIYEWKQKTVLDPQQYSGLSNAVDRLCKRTASGRASE